MDLPYYLSLSNKILRWFRIAVKDILLELNEDGLREGFNKYTGKAYQMLPRLVKPCILDIGCGSGIPTIELARLSGGHIIGLDTDQSLLDRLNERIEAEGFKDRIKAVKCSMFGMDFPDECFDVIWSEGSIYVIGFGRGLKEWRRLLKPGGFLVVHDEVGSIEEKLKQVRDCGYSLMGYFLLSDSVWWTEYLSPLEERIQKLRMKYGDEPEALSVLNKKLDEIEDSKNYGSVFFVMQKL